MYLSKLFNFKTPIIEGISNREKREKRSCTIGDIDKGHYNDETEKCTNSCRDENTSWSNSIRQEYPDSTELISIVSDGKPITNYLSGYGQCVENSQKEKYEQKECTDEWLDRGYFTKKGKCQGQCSTGQYSYSGEGDCEYAREVPEGYGTWHTRTSSNGKPLWLPSDEKNKDSFLNFGQTNDSTEGPSVASYDSTTLNNYPMNIKSSYKTDTNKCSNKCAYSFSYPTSKLTLTNSSTHLDLDYDNGSSAPVLFNNEKYEVYKIHILNTPLHYYDGTGGFGEVLIYHISNDGGKPLIVSIPIVNNDNLSTATSGLKKILALANTNSQEVGDSFTLNTDTFSLNDFVPATGVPFYTYNGVNLVSSSFFGSEETHYITYSNEHGIGIDDNSKDILNKLIDSSLFDIGANPTTSSPDDEEIKSNIFYNETGAQSYIDEDEIYIDCKPTGSEGSETTFKYKPDTILGGITLERYEFVMDLLYNGILALIVTFILWMLPTFITSVMNGGDPMKALKMGAQMQNLVEGEGYLKKMNIDSGKLNSEIESISKSLSKLIGELYEKPKDMGIRDSIRDEKKKLSGLGIFEKDYGKYPQLKFVKDANLGPTTTWGEVGRGAKKMGDIKNWDLWKTGKSK